MANTIGPYLGVDGKARKVKKIFYGIDGKARKVRKGYIGDENGKAQLWFEGLPDTISCTMSNVVSMDWTRYGAAVAGKYGIFGGGDLNDDFTANVIAIEKGTLTMATAPSLSSARARPVGASTGKLAYIASGHTNNSRYKSCFYYNESLSMGGFDLSSNHSVGAGAQAGNYALVAGGETRNTLTSTVCTSLVEALTDSATIVSAPNLPTAVSAAGSGKMGSRAVFVGGSTGTSSSSTNGTNKVAVYSADLTQVTFPDTSLARCMCGVAGSEKILIVAGTGSANPATYEMYSADGTKIGTSYSMYYGGWMKGGCVLTETDAYPDGLICFANMSAILGFDGKDGTLVVQQATGLESAASSYHYMGVADFGDDVIIPLLASGDKIAQFKATEI